MANLRHYPSLILFYISNSNMRKYNNISNIDREAYKYGENYVSLANLLKIKKYTMYKIIRCESSCLRATYPKILA